MRDLLRKGYTVYINKKDESIKGVGLKKLENGKGITTYELDESKIKALGEFPGLAKRFDEGDTLQMTREYTTTG
ncbi:MAG: hypothetical protein K2I67_02035, partial [Malacoplasma sp.]|nr:hypothetical protein [Malacoplasma sp.]